MAERIRHASIYIGGRKVATASQNSVELNSGDEAQIADDGYLGHSDGAELTNMSFDTIEVARKADSATVVAALKSKQPLQMSAGLVGGQIHEVEMRCVKAVFTSESAKGTQTGKFDFEGGPTKAIG